MSPEPADDGERIRSLDVLRGFAVLGILLMNVQSFAMPESAYINPTAYGSLAGANGWVWLFSHIAADGKFMAIFSMLFGAGVLLFTARAESRGDLPGRLHARRMLWLVVFGLAHAYLLWYGDILVAYGICGLLVYPLRRMRPGKQLVLGLAVVAVASFLAIAEGRAMPSWSEEKRAEYVDEIWSPPAEYVDEEMSAYRGDWREQMTDRVPVAWALETEYFLHSRLWRIAGLMLLGMALFKWDVFSARRSSRFYLAMALAGAGIAIPLILLGVHLNRAHGWSPDYSLFFGGQFNYWASLPMALAWIGFVMWACRQPRLARALAPLESAGRMAFTNYILESALCSFIFYGHGLGLFGRVDRAGQLGIVLAIWAIVLVISSVWLRSFRYGPLEWLWRGLTYGRLPPLRRTFVTQIVCMMLLLSALPAAADVGASVGWEGDARRGNGFASLEHVLELGNRNSLVVSASGSLFYYRVIEDGEEVRISSAGGGLDLAMTFQLGETVVSAGPGIELMRERSVYDFGLILREWTWGPRFGLDLEAPVDSSITLTLDVSYAHPSRYLWARSAAFFDPAGSDLTERTGLALGLEITAQGNADTRIYQVGPVLEIAHRTGIAALRLRTGFTLVKSFGSEESIGGYLGAEITCGSAVGDPG